VGFLLLAQLTVDGQWRGFLIQQCDSLEPVLPSSRLFGYVSLPVMSRNKKGAGQNCIFLFPEVVQPLLDLDSCGDY
jgi:hypothetical protein